MKTVICDIDGTIFKYSPDGTYHITNEKQEILPGVVKKFNEWEAKGCRIILITGRRENTRKITEEALTKAGIPFDVLLMGFADTGRVLINDMNSKGKIKAHAINLQRDSGFLGNIETWKEVDL